MIDPIEFVEVLKKLKIHFVTGVPDSLLKDVCACITSNFSTKNHIISTNEGSAVSLAIGHFLATGHLALVYMQNSGLGNAINPLTSLADPQVFGIPMIIMVGWRGEIINNGEQIHDEPQHVKQGQITLQQLEILDIPYYIVDGCTQDIGSILKELVGLAMSRSGPVALIVRKQAFAPFSRFIPSDYKDAYLTREEAISALVEVIPNDIPIVSTTGMASRELFDIRKSMGKGHQRDFLTVGGMGHAGQIAAGIAMAVPDRQIVCIDGDGAVLMHMGSLIICSECKNILHIILNNGAYDSVGGQPTRGINLEYTRIARECGYNEVAIAVTQKEIETHIKHMLRIGVSSFLEIKCKVGGRADLGRPDRSPVTNKLEFMRFIQEKP